MKFNKLAMDKAVVTLCCFTAIACVVYGEWTLAAVNTFTALSLMINMPDSFISNWIDQMLEKL